MREIKFRGKRLDNGEWVYGYVYQYQGKTYVSYERIEMPTYGDPSGTWIYNEYDVDPSTVGQYTGVNDKDGKEIWEGDFVSHIHLEFIKESPCPVKYNAYNGAFVVMPKDKESWWDLNDSYTVVGNIHENG